MLTGHHPGPRALILFNRGIDSGQDVGCRTVSAADVNGDGRTDVSFYDGYGTVQVLLSRWRSPWRA